ncbi:hypothetical protein B0T26DRAFT_841465 [Lasiosphaeria miniovina]|uniref:DUF1996 domain-containing protein n=1 Tax=Lasiosphaeria miniovina TaxID=1954250 RepID=A0AA40BFL7_9PEZI|nr:uncharacterized protein B0T26DRAFT_841465 [Lasiosphaeria miniovina]KAK0733043.1 hypothetical protein B0T26DRAFT_841465 [Lasiosphaeria miniovina]
MHWSTAILAFAALADAAPPITARQGRTTMLRFGCPQVVIDRLDPLVNPGQMPTPHVHQIVGGNAFNATMTTGDVSGKASCTTCQFSDDFSNYWTANLYFKARNGSYKRVTQGSAALQFNDKFSNQINGGILIYYVSANPGKITAFKPGFRMLVGDPNMRSRPDTSLKRQNCYRCYTGPNFGGDTGAPCQDNNVDSEALPKKACAGGIRSNIHFPTCWDGKNLDTPNHKDHVAYPVTGPANFLSLGGDCPASHPVRIPQLMYEVVWDTTKFNDKSQWPADGSQPFVLSTGDPTGLGQHADYVFGWKADSLQKAMDTAGCMGATCGSLKTQSIDAARKCSVKPLVHENVDGWLTKLPGTDMPM